MQLLSQLELMAIFVFTFNSGRNRFKTSEGFHHHFSFNPGSSTELARFRIAFDVITSRLVILFDHMHPLSPVHFSSFHPLLVFPRSFRWSSFAFFFLFFFRSSP